MGRCLLYQTAVEEMDCQSAQEGLHTNVRKEFIPQFNYNYFSTYTLTINEQTKATLMIWRTVSLLAAFKRASIARIYAEYDIRASNASSACTSNNTYTRINFTSCNKVKAGPSTHQKFAKFFHIRKNSFQNCE